MARKSKRRVWPKPSIPVGPITAESAQAIEDSWLPEPKQSEATKREFDRLFRSLFEIKYPMEPD